MPIWAQLQATLAGGGPAMLVTVVATRGSSPREAGARMIVGPDGSFNGTIGGGALEWQAIAIARSGLNAAGGARARLRGFALGPELAQCCGGHVDILFERFDENDRAYVGGMRDREAAGSFATRGVITDAGLVRTVLPAVAGDAGDVGFEAGVLSEGFGDDRRRLFLFGAGHVGRALVLALAPLPYALTWIDPRPDAFPTHVPANVDISLLGDDPKENIAAAPAGSFALVMSHSHPLDLTLVRMVLSDERFDYVGLIGSATKRARFEKRLAGAGISQRRIDSLNCPIGRPGIRGKVPAVIAASVVSDLIERDEEMRADHRTLGVAGVQEQRR